MPAPKAPSKDIHVLFLPSHLIAQEAHHAPCMDVDRCGCARWLCIDSSGSTGGEQRYQRYGHGCWTGRRAQGSSDGAEYRHKPYGERDEQSKWIFRVSKPAAREVYADGHGTGIPDDEQHGVLDPDRAASPCGYGSPGGHSDVHGGCIGINNTAGEYHIERSGQHRGADQDPESSIEPAEFLCADSVAARRERFDQYESDEPWRL